MGNITLKYLCNSTLWLVFSVQLILLCACFSHNLMAESLRESL